MENKQGKIMEIKRIAKIVGGQDGAILLNGKIYSTEGFRSDLVNRPAIRIIDIKTKEQKYIDIESWIC